MKIQSSFKLNKIMNKLNSNNSIRNEEINHNDLESVNTISNINTNCSSSTSSYNANINNLSNYTLNSNKTDIINISNCNTINSTINNATIDNTTINTNKSESYLIKNDDKDSINNDKLNFTDEKTMKLKKHRPNRSISSNLYEPNSNKFTAKQKKCLIAILVAEFSAFATMACISPFFPDRAAKLGLSSKQSGLIFSIYAIASVIFSPIMGKVIPIFGARNIMLIGILANGLSNISFGLTEYITNEYWFFYTCLILRIIEAYGTISHVCASYTYVIKVFPNDISYVFSLTESFVGAGLASGPALGGLIYSISSYGVPFYTFGTIVLCCFPITWFFVPIIKDDDSLSDPRLSIKENLEFGLPAKQMTFTKVVLKLEVLINSSVLILGATSNSFFFPTLEEHLKKLNFVNIEIVSLMFFLGSAVYVISTLVLGKYLDEIKYQYGIMLIGMLLTIASLLFVGPSELLFFLDPKSLVNTCIAMILMGLGNCAAYLPTFSVYYKACLKYGLEDNITTYGYVAGFWSCMFSVGESIGPLMGGFLLEIFSFRDSAEIVACLLVLVIPALIVMVIREFRSNESESKIDQTRLRDPISGDNISNASTINAIDSSKKSSSPIN